MARYVVWRRTESDVVRDIVLPRFSPPHCMRCRWPHVYGNSFRKNASQLCTSSSGMWRYLRIRASPYYVPRHTLGYVRRHTMHHATPLGFCVHRHTTYHVILRTTPYLRVRASPYYVPYHTLGYVRRHSICHATPLGFSVHRHTTHHAIPQQDLVDKILRTRSRPHT